MDKNARELIRREKEKRKLEREQRRREQLKRSNVKSDEEIPKDIGKENLEKLMLNVNESIENNVSTGENKKLVRSSSKSVSIKYIEEPSVPTNKKSINRNVKEEFAKYVENEKNLNRSFKKQKHYLNDQGLTNKVTNNLGFISEKKENNTRTNYNERTTVGKKTGEEDENNIHEVMKSGGISKMVKVKEAEIDAQKLNENGKGIEGDEENVEEVYEIIESDDVETDLIKNKMLIKKLKKEKRVFERENKVMVDDEIDMEKAEDLGKELQKNLNNFKINKVEEKDKYVLLKEEHAKGKLETPEEMENKEFFKWFHNYLHDIEKYAPDESAYFEEIEYLYQMLKNKKKKMLGNFYDENKKEENNKITEEDMLAKLDEFHKNSNAEGRKTTGYAKEEKSLDIDEIYKVLEIKKKEDSIIGFPFYDNINEAANDSKETEMNMTEKKSEVNHLPKGFFDDKEERNYLSKHSGLEKIDELIKLVEKERKELLQEYEVVGKAYEEKVNSYIDYLYEQEFENKNEILQNTKQKRGDDKNEEKGENRLLIEAIIEEAKRNKKKSKEERKKMDEYLMAYKAS